MYVYDHDISGFYLDVHMHVFVVDILVDTYVGPFLCNLLASYVCTQDL